MTTFFSLPVEISGEYESEEKDKRMTRTVGRDIRSNGCSRAILITRHVFWPTLYYTLLYGRATVTGYNPTIWVLFPNHLISHLSLYVSSALLGFLFYSYVYYYPLNLELIIFSISLYSDTKKIFVRGEYKK